MLTAPQSSLCKDSTKPCTNQGFIYWGVQGGIFPPPQTLNLHPPPPIFSPSSVCTLFLAAINPKVIQIQLTCQYKVPTKWVWSIKGILPPLNQKS